MEGECQPSTQIDSDGEDEDVDPKQRDAAATVAPGASSRARGRNDHVQRGGQANGHPPQEGGQSNG